MVADLVLPPKLVSKHRRIKTIERIVGTMAVTKAAKQASVEVETRKINAKVNTELSRPMIMREIPRRLTTVTMAQTTMRAIWKLVARDKARVVLENSNLAMSN